MAGYSSALWAGWCARNGCITKDTPPPFHLPLTTFGYTPAVPLGLIEEILDDAPRPGGPATFSPEQIVQIVAVACEPPEESGTPDQSLDPSRVGR